MLAATTHEFDSLGIMKFALRMRKTDSNIPEVVRAHFNEILRIGKLASQDIRLITPGAPPEALEFAVKLLARQSVRDLFFSFEDLNDLPPERAGNALSQLEASSVLG